jgi:hypothetical protein
MEIKKGGFRKEWRVTYYDHFCVFSIFLHFGRFHGNGSHFEKNQPLRAQLHMAYDIPTRFHSCHGNKKGGFKIILDSFHQAS